MNRLIVLLALVVSLNGCALPPPNLTPEATSAFNKTRVIKGLDLIRDTAIDASTPPSTVMSVDATRTVVTAHQSLLKIIESTGTGWQRPVSVTLAELLNNLSDKDRMLLRPYVELVNAILAEMGS